MTLAPTDAFPCRICLSFPTVCGLALLTAADPAASAFISSSLLWSDVLDVCLPALATTLAISPALNSPPLLSCAPSHTSPACLLPLCPCVECGYVRLKGCMYGVAAAVPSGVSPPPVPRSRSAPGAEPKAKVQARGARLLTNGRAKARLLTNGELRRAY